MTVYVYTPCRPPKSGHPGPCLLCPQLISALPGEGLTLRSVQPAVHSQQSTGCSRDAVSADIPSLGPPSGQDPGVQGGGGGAATWRGACQGPGMRVRGGEATGPTGSASFLPRLSLPGCLPRAGGGRDEPHVLRAPGWGTARPTRTRFCWSP